MFEKLEVCPSCGHPKFQNHLIATDHMVSSESFALVKCSKCQLVFTNPRPSLETISSYYDSDKYYSHHKSFSPVGILYSIAKYFTLRWKSKIINRYVNKPGRLLDYGCGTGDFLHQMQSKQWSVTGVEKDPDARKLAVKKTSSEILDNNQTLSGTFNVITLWHVLEHLHDLKTTFRELLKLLDRDGYLLIALPNISSEDSHHYKEYWAGLDVPRHLYHFDKESFEQFIQPHRIQLVDITPMKLDAYYVSLLSEKYKSGGCYLRAFQQATKSNKQAKNTGQYSSLIYVLKR